MLTKTAEFQSTHPARGATTRTSTAQANVRFQSTHPARGATRISTHCCVTCTFQSTHPARGATRCSRGCLDTRSNFNPRTPRGVRPLFVSAFDQYDYDFNPRTPRGVRRHHQVPSIAGTRFQSTHPARGATFQGGRLLMTNRISIHAPREGCDSSSPASKTVSHADFNPRTPRGVRHWESSRDAPACDFNPRTPRGVRQARWI